MSKLTNIAKNINIKNQRASFEYEFLEKFTAGIQLQGTEIKSIRQGKANLTDAYAYFTNDELFIKNLHISEYEKGTYNNHDPRRERKLLLTKHEIRRIGKKLKDQGITIIPIRVFISESGYAKIEIAVARGKKLYDKREDIKQRDTQKQLDRLNK
jgi:SsrA-binding protein